MKITVLCSSSIHPVNQMLKEWIEENQRYHTINLVRSIEELPGGELLFLISCSEIVRRQDRDKYQKVLVIHASDLPRGRGWSPHVWDIVNGATSITLSMIEAEDALDTGDVWKKIVLPIPDHALFDEINSILFAGERALMDFAVASFFTVFPQPQNLNIPASYHLRRCPEDSKIDPQSSIESQFDLIRVADSERFPAFFELRGHTYKLTVEKIQ